MLPPFTAAMTAPCRTTTQSNRTTLTVIDRHSRQISYTQEVEDAVTARALFYALGNGFDAEIRTARYTEQILGC